MLFCQFAIVCKNNLICFNQGARKPTGENLKVVWAEVSTLRLAVLKNVYNSLSVQTWPSLDLKARLRFRPVSLSLSMVFT
jgi:hypothetical protein